MATQTTQWDTLVKQVKEVISEVAKVDPDKLDVEANIYETYGVDSLMAVRAISSLDVQFDIEIPEERVQNVRSIRELVEIVRDELDKKGAAKA